jgi:hypothetical protein
MSETTPAARLRIALDLCDLGIALMRQNLRRRHPGESAVEIERRLRAWLRDRPGAVDGDTARGRRRPDAGGAG